MLLMMTVAETLHFAIMVCAISVTNVKTAGTESTEHVALVEQLRREILVGNLQREIPAKRRESGKVTRTIEKHDKNRNETCSNISLGIRLARIKTSKSPKNIFIFSFLLRYKRS